MNTFVITFAIVLAIAAASPGQVSLSQDTTGNYKLSYDTEDSSRSEEGFAGGKVVGTFTFKDKEGTVHTIKYLSSAAGFSAEGADIPTSVEEPAAVLAVRAAHQAKQDKQRALLPPLKEEQSAAPVAPAPVAPAAPTFAAPTFAAPTFTAPTNFLGFAPAKPAVVDNSAEIEAAKALHFAAHEDALARLAAAYQKLSK